MNQSRNFQKKGLIAHNKHAIILSPRKDQGIKEAFFFNLQRKSLGDGDPTPDPEIISTVRVPILLKFCQPQFFHWVAACKESFTENISILCVCINHQTGSIKALCPCYHLEWLTAVTQKGSSFFIWDWTCLAMDIRIEDSLVGRQVKQDPLKKWASRAKPDLFKCRVTGTLDRAGEDGAMVRRWGSSPRGRAGFYTYRCIQTCCAAWKKRVSAIHVLLTALIPTSEVSEKLSPGRPGQDPTAVLLSGRCSVPALTRRANITLAMLTGRKMPRGVLNVAVTAVSGLFLQGAKKDAALWWVPVLLRLYCLRVGLSKAFTWT